MYKMSWSAMVTAVKSSLPDHAAVIIQFIKTSRTITIGHFNDAESKCQIDIRSSITTAITAMRKEPSPLPLFEVLRDLVKVRQGPGWTKGYEIFCNFEDFQIQSSTRCK